MALFRPAARGVGRRPVLFGILLAVVTGTAVPQSTTRLTAAESFRLPGFEYVTALRVAYPERIERIEARAGEWALMMDGRWYYWAEGRLLPAERRLDWEEYVSIRFYNYQPGPHVLPPMTPEREAALRKRNESFENDDSQRYNGFLDALYGISSAAEAEALMVRMTLFGRLIRVHPMVVQPLVRVENRIREIAEGDKETREFVAGLSQVHGFNWRNIAGTQRRSYHSYGVAVDFIPQQWGGRWAYWRWAYQGGVEDWWNIPLTQRWSPPQTVIDAFETEGFIWGGKWTSFDPVHFEYRPEALILAGHINGSALGDDGGLESMP